MVWKLPWRAERAGGKPGTLGESAADLFAAAHRLAKEGEHHRAVEALQKCLLIAPDNRLALLTLIQILAHLGQHEEALDACARVLRIEPESRPALESLEHILPNVRHTERPGEAVEALKKCLAASPQHFQMLQILGELLLRLNRHREALETYMRALDLNSHIPTWEVIRKILAEHGTDPDIAELCISVPTLPDGYARLAAHNLAKMLARILANFYEKMDIDPHVSPLFEYLERFQNELLIDESDANSQDSAFSNLVQFEAAWRHYLDGDIDTATRLFECIFRDPMAHQRAANDPFIMETIVKAGEILARQHERAGNFESAISIYRDIIALVPNGIIARRLIVLLSRQGKLHDAAALAEMAVASSTNLSLRLMGNPYLTSLKAGMTAS